MPHWVEDPHACVGATQGCVRCQGTHRSLLWRGNGRAVHIVEWHIHFMRGFTCTEVGGGAGNLSGVWAPGLGRGDAASAAETCDVTRWPRVGYGACRLHRKTGSLSVCMCWPVRQGVT